MMSHEMKYVNHTFHSLAQNYSAIHYLAKEISLDVNWCQLYFIAWHMIDKESCKMFYFIRRSRDRRRRKEESSRKFAKPDVNAEIKHTGKGSNDKYSSSSKSSWKTAERQKNDEKFRRENLKPKSSSSSSESETEKDNEPGN